MSVGAFTGRGKLWKFAATDRDLGLLWMRLDKSNAGKVDLTSRSTVDSCVTCPAQLMEMEKSLLLSLPLLLIRTCWPFTLTREDVFLKMLQFHTGPF